MVWWLDVFLLGVKSTSYIEQFTVQFRPTVVTAGALGLSVLHHCLCRMMCAAWETNTREVFATTYDLAVLGHSLCPLCLSVHQMVYQSVNPFNYLSIHMIDICLRGR